MSPHVASGLGWSLDLEQGEPGNAVNYLAPSVTWKYEFHLCEGVGAKFLMTLWQHWGMAFPVGLLFIFDSEQAFFLTSVNVGKRAACAWSSLSPSVYPPDGCQLSGAGVMTPAKQCLVFLWPFRLFTCCSGWFCCDESSQ